MVQVPGVYVEQLPTEPIEVDDPYLREVGRAARRRSTREWLTARAKSLAKRFDIDTASGAGAFGMASLKDLEYVMHELAHLLTMGVEIGPEVGSYLGRIDNELAKYSVATQNSLEIDTSYIVWQAGILLGVWESDFYAYKIAYSCAENCQAPPKVSKLLSVEDVRDEWKARGHDHSLRDKILALHDVMTGEYEENQPQGEDEEDELSATGDAGGITDNGDG